MRVLFWYCDQFAWNPTMKTLDDAPDADADAHENAVVAFIHVEPKDVENDNSAETKLVKNGKWLARKWETKIVILHSFTHLGEEKADPEYAKALIDRAQRRLEAAGYTAIQTPYGYFNDLTIQAQGHPLARIYKEF
jgi:threonyl-tRNA synthetase editing subunit